MTEEQFWRKCYGLWGVTCLTLVGLFAAFGYSLRDALAINREITERMSRFEQTMSRTVQDSAAMSAELLHTQQALQEREHDYHAWFIEQLRVSIPESDFRRGLLTRLTLLERRVAESAP